jgi:hypothetical protein
LGFIQYKKESPKRELKRDKFVIYKYDNKADFSVGNKNKFWEYKLSVKILGE